MLRFRTAVLVNGWGTGSRTQIEGSATQHALHYTMPHLSQFGRGTRIRTGVQGSEAPDAIHYTMPPSKLMQDSGCTQGVNRYIAVHDRDVIIGVYRGAVWPHFGLELCCPSCCFPLR